MVGLSQIRQPGAKAAGNRDCAEAWRLGTAPPALSDVAAMVKASAIAPTIRVLLKLRNIFEPFKVTGYTSYVPILQNAS